MSWYAPTHPLFSVKNTLFLPMDSLWMLLAIILLFSTMGNPQNLGTLVRFAYLNIFP